MSEGHLKVGHRQRLRERLLEHPDTLSESEKVELLLAYAIPRQDVAPLAEALLARFGDIAGLLAAGYEELLGAPGVGPYSAGLIRLVGLLRQAAPAEAADPPLPAPTTAPTLHPIEQQTLLLPVASDLGPLFEEQPSAGDPPIRTFTNDLIQAALTFLPQALGYDDVVSYRAHLLTALPYNSLNSRRRYASNLLARYFPAGTLETPLMRLLAYAPDDDTFKAALLYETTRVEPALQLVTEQIIWPALPTGFLTREQLKERVIALFPDAGPATIQRMVLSLINTYTGLGTMDAREGVLRLQQRTGTPDAFVYVLAAEFPESGMYSFERLEEGPARRWLLWDRAWMRRQLYGLASLDILSKVSEIDAFRQFSLPWDRAELLSRYFEHPHRHDLALRETETSL